MSGKIRIAKTVQSKSFELRHQDVKKKWVIVDANGVVLGRLAAGIVAMLRGKHRPTFTPSVDSGDNVIVINAEKVKITGKKAENKNFYYHTGHPGGIKARTRAYILASEHPERILLNSHIKEKTHISCVFSLTSKWFCPIIPELQLRGEAA